VTQTTFAADRPLADNSAGHSYLWQPTSPSIPAPHPPQSAGASARRSLGEGGQTNKISILT
jgi:hypothetical protein